MSSMTMWSILLCRVWTELCTERSAVLAVANTVFVLRVD